MMCLFIFKTTTLAPPFYNTLQTSDGLVGYAAKQVQVQNGKQSRPVDAIHFLGAACSVSVTIAQLLRLTALSGNQ
jgi:hypothetical protein